ncbi:InlB B-repeat-containing protein, partial [Bifidobacterium sp. MA2]
MTGNTSKWRAPLAGLASVAMLATMGVAASTANAATYSASPSFDVKVFKADAPAASAYWGASKRYTYGKAFDLDQLTDPYSGIDNKVLTGYSYDLAGKNKVADGKIAIKGDTKLYAQYAAAHVVTFYNEDGTSVLGQADVKSGAALDAETYAKSGAEAAADSAKPSGKKFVGWKLSTAQDNNDFYTTQAISADTKLYAVYESYAGPQDQENLSVVKFHVSDSTADYTRYTLAGNPFPAFRVPAWDGVSGSTTEYLKDVDQWSADKGNSSAYNFGADVENSNVNYGAADLTLYGFGEFGDKNWTVTYKFQDANSLVDGDAVSYDTTKVNVAAGSKIVKPNDPAKWDREFTGWYADGKDVDFNTAVENLPGANKAKRTVTVYAGWDKENISQVVYNYNYFTALWANPTSGVYAAKGQAIDFVTKGSKINAPTGVEDYFQTAADKAHNTYTSRTVKGWASVKDDAPISVVKADTEVYAQWAGVSAVKLNGNGGDFKNGTHYAYATLTDGQKWQDVVETPTRSGFTFAGWYQSATSNVKANLSDGYWYTGTTKGAAIADNDTLVARWTPTEQLDNEAAFFAFPLKGATEATDWTPDFSNKSADYKLAEKYAKTEASWKTYVDYVYSLEDEFNAYNNLKPGQEKIDAGRALAAKLQAAQAKLVDDKAPAGTTTVYRLFNPNARDAGSHHYTASVVEYN